MNGFEASAAEITALFDALSDSLSAELVARNPASHGRMEVDSARGKRVVVSNDGDTLADLVFGKQGRGSQQIYVRPRGDERVYLLESEFA
ncbi:MAG: DUF4340 domain-containing protein, partial [Gammaproteobacteria bacterium]|nr:DUF4340 domain-containing protein [Gammaproteobacteria bacterium]